MVTHSVILTVFDREAEVLLRTLKGLAEGPFDGVELIVVNDGSEMSYGWARGYVAKLGGTWVDLAEYPAWRGPGGFNNPARAFNEGLLRSTGETVVAMSSDVIVPPRTMRRMKTIKTSEMLWTPFVEDTHSEPPLHGHYCGPKRLFPMPWFLAMSREHAVEVGGWDEGYLDGLCYEDNDFVGRVVLRTGRFMGDWGYKVYHQGHVQDAYRIDNPEIAAANARNRERTLEKWGGVPFEMEFTPFDVSRRMHPSGNAVHECVAKSGKLEKVIEMTTGIVRNAGTVRSFGKRDQCRA